MDAQAIPVRPRTTYNNALVDSVKMYTEPKQTNSKATPNKMVFLLPIFIEINPIGINPIMAVACAMRSGVEKPIDNTLGA